MVEKAWSYHSEIIHRISQGCTTVNRQGFPPRYPLAKLNSVCRYLHASRNYQKITRQGRKTAGYSSRYTLRSPTSLGMVGSASQHSLVPFLDFPPSRTTEIQDIARLAGLGVEEVPALALRLEGPVRRTQDLVSDALEFPHEVALLLWWETLRLWRVFGYGFWGLKLGCGFLLFLCGCWFGNGNRVAIKLILLGLCGLFSGLSLGYLLPACVIICLIARLD